jgi:hypothetical protein
MEAFTEISSSEEISSTMASLIFCTNAAFDFQLFLFRNLQGFLKLCAVPG